jgi:hypothetical protein
MEQIFESYEDLVESGYSELYEAGTLGHAGKQNVIEHSNNAWKKWINKTGEPNASAESVEKLRRRSSSANNKRLESKSRNEKAAKLRLKRKGKAIVNKVKSNGRTIGKVGAGIAATAGAAYVGKKIYDKNKKCILPY